MLLRIHATAYETFRTLIKNGNYEKLILNIINNSTKLFPNKYKHLDHSKQSNGECDFIDVTTKEKYDAKLPFSPEQGKLIGSNNGSFEEWLRTMQDETNEFAQAINHGFSNFDIKNLTLYKIMRQRILSVKPEENIIFLFPYPIVIEQEPLIIGQFATDILKAIFDELEKSDVIGRRELYAIYPAKNDRLVIRLLNGYAREFVDNTELNKYIEYTFI